MANLTLRRSSNCPAWPSPRLSVACPETGYAAQGCARKEAVPLHQPEGSAVQASPLAGARGGAETQVSVPAPPRTGVARVAPASQA